MLLVICGAGASYDAVSDATVRPPLAGQLFDDRPDFLEVLRERPAARSLVQRLRAVAPTGGAVEEVLGEFMALASTDGDPAYKRDAIGLRFYLKDVVQRSAAAAENDAAFITNYLSLVTQIHDARRQDVAYVSFNYDTMLESAINSRFGGSIGKDLSSYLSGPVQVFKPHGSVNWVQMIPALQPPGPDRSYPYMHSSLPDVAEYADFDAGGDIEILQQEQIGHGRDAFFVPAIAVPVTNKDAFVMPDDHYATMVEVLRRTTRILTIGWRGSELKFQEAARTFLSSNLLPAMVVTKGSDRSAGDETINNLASNLNRGAIEVVLDGFTGLCRMDALRDFAAGVQS